jgi:hypothetical protein
MSGAVVKGLFSCRVCGSDEMEAMSDGEGTNFLCNDCWTCWNLEMGLVRRVTPGTCGSCDHQDDCLTLIRVQGPRRNRRGRSRVVRSLRLASTPPFRQLD